MKTKISIAVLDKSEVLLSSFRNYFSNHSKICLIHSCKHSNYLQKLLIKSDVPDILFWNVIGMTLKVVNAESAILKSIAPNMKIVLVGNTNSNTISKDLLTGNIDGFVAINSDIEHFEHYVNMLQNGSFIIFNKNLSDEKEVVKNKEAESNVSFSSKEKVIIKFLNTTSTHKEIANELQLRFDTYNYHLKSIYKKLGVRKRHAAIASFENKLVFEEAFL